MQFILLGIPVMMLLGIIILPGALASFRGLPSSFLNTYIIYFIVIFFGGGPLGEEIRLAWICSSTNANSIWGSSSYPSSWYSVDFLALTSFPYNSSKRRSRFQLIYLLYQFAYFLLDGHVHHSA